MSSSIRHWRALSCALSCALSLGAVTLPAQKTKAARSATVAAAAPVPTVLTQRAELEKIIQRKVLPNGLEVIVVENHGVPLATVEVDVRNGSFTQAPKYEGLVAPVRAHVLQGEHATIPSPSSSSTRASELGAVFNGTTQEERVNYYLTVPADSTATAGCASSPRRCARRSSARTSSSASARS